MRGEATMSDMHMVYGTQDPNDRKLLVKFELFPEIDQAASVEEGRPIYRDVDYVTIMVPGDKESVVHRKVWAKDLDRFPAQYQAYKNGQSQEAVSGTPLSMWPVVTKAQVLELGYFHVKTVEHLAELADAHAHKFMGINKLRQQARDWLAASKDTAHITKMNEELEKRDSQISALVEQNKKLNERLEALEAEEA
jgi:hypothetical protein